MNYKVDKDLLAVQEARIVIEQAEMVAQEMKQWPQETLDQICTSLLKEIEPQIEGLAERATVETNYGNVSDKVIKNRLICQRLEEAFANQKYVGILNEDLQTGLMEIGVPVGVVVAMIPATNPIATTIHNVLIALKSGNPIIISPHPRAQKTIAKTVAFLQEIALASGLPKGGLVCMQLVSDKAVQEFLTNEKVALVLATGIPKLLPKLQHSVKPYFYGGSGNGPVFLERTCVIDKAVSDIMLSRTFDHGLVSAAEQSVVVDEPIQLQVRQAFQKQGAYFMNEQETEQVLSLLQKTNGTLNPEFVGQTAVKIARMARINVPATTRVLVYEKPYVSEHNPFSEEFLCPVMAYYIEPDWQQACERCIELLVHTSKSHTLILHSTDTEVIRNFALKKPVSRMLVNTPGTFGGMGVTSQLFPAMTLGSTALGIRKSSENLSPTNLTSIRRVAFESRDWKTCTQQAEEPKQSINTVNLTALADIIQKLSNEL